MSLEDQVKSRYGTQDLIGWTNPSNVASTGIDEARLSNAARDVEGMFLVYVQEAYDESRPEHVAIAVDGVITILKVRNALEKRAVFEAWIKNSLTPLRDVTSRTRAGPRTNSRTVPSDPIQKGRPLRPWFDNRRFRFIIPGAPTVGEDPGYRVW